MGVYTLPDLPYDYSALEPWISGEIMQLHHDKHHKAYVDGANTALEQLDQARASGNLGAVNKLEKDLAFNLGGHLNHSVFWTLMGPDKGGRPEGELAAAIDDAFGCFDAFKAHFAATSTGIQGSGWGVLAWDLLGQRLQVFQLYDHQANGPLGQIPLLLLDMWEHAFYLQYKNVKADYVNAWWNVVDWPEVGRRLQVARAAGPLLAGPVF